jgi:hypothetical protein
MVAPLSLDDPPGAEEYQRREERCRHRHPRCGQIKLEWQRQVVARAEG